MRDGRIDPLTLEVIWNRLLSVANEQQDALIRTAFSTIVRESQDLACGLFDVQGRMIAQSVSGTPGHINAMATSMRHFLAAYPPGALAPGDVLITNDPWMTAGQINDITITTPIFKNGRLVALFANTCHSADIGGRILSAEAREVYEEGLRIPIMKLFEQGEPNETLLEIVRVNVRQPDEVVGDFYAQTACNDAGGRALLETMEEFGLESLEPVAEEIVRRSEAAVRSHIRDLADGEWQSETWSDGFEEPIVIRCSCGLPAGKSTSILQAHRHRARTASTLCSTIPMPMPALQSRRRFILMCRTMKGASVRFTSQRLPAAF